MGAVTGTHDALVFQSTIGYHDRCGNRITSTGALELSELAASYRLSEVAFLSAFRSSCDFATSRTLGIGAAVGSHDSMAFQATLGHGSRCGNRISASGALEIAKLLAESKINLALFRSVFFQSCNFESAKQVACANP